MKPWVREKLKQVHDLYPQERLDRSKARWRAMWGQQPMGDRYPFVFSTATFNFYNMMTKEEGLAAYLDEWIARGFVQDDFIPAFFLGCHQGAIPCMFGAQEKIIGGDYTNERILFQNEDIDSLPEPNLNPGTPAARWLEMDRYFLEECEGEMPVHVCDMQGPMDAAAQLFGYDNLFLCAYDDEERFDRLMGLVSDAYCMLWEAQKSLLGDLFVGTHLFAWDWVPQDNGATLSADSMAMLSGAFFAEYYTPILQRIADRVGKLSIHSCGEFSATLAPMGAMDCVQAVNASQMTLEALLAGGWPREKMIILSEPLARAEQVFSLAKAQSLHIDVTLGGLWPPQEQGKPDTWTQAQRQAMLDTVSRVTDLAQL